jgi:hypothetical protein
MDEAYYLNHHIGYKFAVGLGGDYVTTLSKVAMSNFLTLGETYQYFIGVYMQGNTKSNFKLSIRAQIENWLNTDNNKYRTPLSENQFSIASKYVRLYEAKQIATHIYWDR